MGTRLMSQLLRSCFKINDWLVTAWLPKDITVRLGCAVTAVRTGHATPTMSGDTVNDPSQIPQHVCRLVEWALTMCILCAGMGSSWQNTHLTCMSHWHHINYYEVEVGGSGIQDPSGLHETVSQTETPMAYPEKVLAKC